MALQRTIITGLATVVLAHGPSSLAATLQVTGSEQRTDAGGGWDISENQHGAVLRRGNIILYLGRNCDARSPRYGVGRWGWANGGYLVIFPQRRFGFPRQDPPFSAPDCLI